MTLEMAGKAKTQPLPKAQLVTMEVVGLVGLLLVWQEPQVRLIQMMATVVLVVVAVHGVQLEQVEQAVLAAE